MADALGGLVYEHAGAAVLFAVASLTLVIGGAIVWVALREPCFSRGASGQAVVDAQQLVPAPPSV